MPSHNRTFLPGETQAHDSVLKFDEDHVREAIGFGARLQGQFEGRDVMSKKVSIGRAMLSAAALTLCAASGAISSPAPGVKPPELSTEVFRDPQSPDVYRALSGMGAPHIDATAGWSIEFRTENDPEKITLLRRLFPPAGTSQSNQYFSYQSGDCRLEQPLATLQARISALGADHPYVAQWLRVQRAIFATCEDWQQSRSATPAILPAEMQTRDPRVAALQHEDRDYQSASALFYGRQLVAAEHAFDVIAESNSPHRWYARYMSIAIRAGSQPNRYSYEPLGPSNQSLKEAATLYADPAASAVRQDTYGLIGWIGAHDENTEARKVRIRQALDALEAPLKALTPNSEAWQHYAVARDTREFLFGRTDDAAAMWDGSIPADLTSTRALAEAARKDRLAEWMMFPHSPFEKPSDWNWDEAWAMADWPKGTARVRVELAHLAPDPHDTKNPWAHEALMWSDHYDSTLWHMVDGELADARSGKDERSLDAATLDFYHQARTAVMYGGDHGFETALDRLAAPCTLCGQIRTTAVGDSLRYLVATGRIAEARNLRDRLGLSHNLETDNLDLLLLLAEDEDHVVSLLSNDHYEQAPFLNRLSIAELHRLAMREDVPIEDRSAFARTAWTRTYALGRVVDGDLDLLMRKLNPDITNTWKSPPGEAVHPDDHRVLLDVLNTPGLNTLVDEYGRHRKTPAGTPDGHDVAGIDHNRRNETNWWCPWRPKTNDALVDDALRTALTGSPYGPADTNGHWEAIKQSVFDKLGSSSFLLRSTDAAEIAQLTQIRSASEILTERTIDWVEHPGFFESREGQADALAAAVRTSRWGCDWAGRHGVYSHAAYLLLKKRFPESDAAKRTKYWYDCNGECSWNGSTPDGRDSELPSVPSLPAPPKDEEKLVARIWPGAKGH